mmetsp:Transcript_12947/g.27299  ORF Transcript_12947/g.27299 Transcript_12947/m.27299 type:complete len:234 (-) Transcript_12947:25-726(-)
MFDPNATFTFLVRGGQTIVKPNETVASNPCFVTFRGGVACGCPIWLDVCVSLGLSLFVVARHGTIVRIAFVAIVAIILSGIHGILAVVAIGGGGCVRFYFVLERSVRILHQHGWMHACSPTKPLVVAGAVVGCSGIILTLVVSCAWHASGIGRNERKQHDIVRVRLRLCLSPTPSIVLFCFVSVRFVCVRSLPNTVPRIASRYALGTSSIGGFGERAGTKKATQRTSREPPRK